MTKYCFIFLLCWLCGFTLVQGKTKVKAKSSDVVALQTENVEKILERYTDSLTQLRNHYEKDWTYKGKDLLTNPYYYRLFVQPTFYFNPVKQQMDFDWHPQYEKNKDILVFTPLNDDILYTDSMMASFFSNLYVNEPQMITTSQEVVDNEERLRNDLSTNLEHKVDLSSRVKTPKPIQIFEPIQVIDHRPNFWTFKQNYGLQLMEYYFSDNWYQGGNNYNSFLLTANMQANFNNQSKVNFNNTLSMQLGFQTVKGDDKHPWHTTTDQLRLINQLSVKAAKNWSYTATLTSTTRMTPQYKSNNSDDVIADFFSQFESVLSVGMLYSKSIGKVNFNVNMAPLSYDWKYVGRKNLRSRYGLYPNHHSREYYGSNVTINHSWQIIKELAWSGRMYYFTNYHKAQWEWENTFTFTINKYLNTKLYLYPRFDDTVKDENGDYTLQLKQWLSLGFNISL